MLSKREYRLLKKMQDNGYVRHDSLSLVERLTMWKLYIKGYVEHTTALQAQRSEDTTDKAPDGRPGENTEKPCEKMAEPKLQPAPPFLLGMLSGAALHLMLALLRVLLERQ